MTRRRVDAALVLVAVSAALAAVRAVDAEPILGSWVFASILFVLLALSVRTAVSAVVAARRQRRRAAVVQDVSTHQAVQTALARERRRMSADIVATVRQALERTAVLTESLAIAADPGPVLRAVQAEGRAAAVELRRQLGLLRDEEPDPPPTRPAAPSGAHRPRRSDVLLGAGVATLAVVVGLFVHEESPSAVQLGFSAAAAATLALWRLNPGLAATINALLTAVALGLGHPVPPDLWMILTDGPLIWACVARPVRDKLAVVGPVALIVAVLLNDWVTNRPNVHVMASVIVIALVTAVGFRFAETSRWRSERVVLSHEQELAEAAALAVRADRLQLARELHDTVSGTVGTITMRAAAAEMLWDSDPARAHESIEIVHRAIGGALADLDHLMPTLDAARGSSGRTEDPSEGGPGMIDGLVQRMREAGVAIEADLDPVLDDAPSVLVRTAYRVVQEALANCARHAPGARAVVRVHRVDAELVVEVTDDGPGLRGAQPGYGLVGMRERVAAVSGTVSLRTGDGGVGLRIRISLPWDAMAGVTR